MSSAPARPGETSGTSTTRVVLGHVRAVRGEEAVERVLAAAALDRQRDVLLRDGGWTDHASRLALFAAVADELGGPRALVEAGAAATRQSLRTPGTLLRRALGSPAQVYRRVPRTVAASSTARTAQAIEVGPDSATLAFRLHDGYPRSRLDCLYAQGRLCAVPELFGLPAARSVHSACEADGAPACVHHLTWAPRRRDLPRRPTAGR